MAKLYVVATPIGNLQDFSPRGIETLRQADLIVAEDTRVTMKLCQVFDIHTRMTSCHRHNEESKGLRIAEQIAEENLTAALTTDAGTPCISDPGNELIRAAVENGIRVVGVPGPCAAVTALSISGFDLSTFFFYGFFHLNINCVAKLTAPFLTVFFAYFVKLVYDYLFDFCLVSENILHFGNILFKVVNIL